MAYITDDNVELPVADGWAWPSGMSDSEKTDIIQNACDTIDQVTRSHWESTSKTLYLSGDGTQYLDVYRILSWPILSITSVTFRNDYAASDNFGTVGTLIADSDYAIAPSKRSLIKIQGTTFRTGGDYLGTPFWSCGYENYKVVGAFGRTNTPLGITLAAKYLVRELVTPGSTADRATMQGEKWADGYSYVRSGGPTARNPERLTGIGAVDDILIHFVNWTPFMAVPR